MNTFIIILVSEKQIFPSMSQVFPGICFRVTGPSLIICTRMDSFNWNLHCELRESKAFWLSWLCSQSQTIFTPANSHNRYERRSRIKMGKVTGNLLSCTCVKMLALELRGFVSKVQVKNISAKFTFHKRPSWGRMWGPGKEEMRWSAGQGHMRGINTNP